MRSYKFMLKTALAALICTTLCACIKRDEVDLNREGLTLIANPIGDRLVVLMVNASANPVAINGLLRPVGLTKELTIYIDGREAEFKNKWGAAIVSPQNISGAHLVLEPDEVHGTSIRLSDIKSLFGLSAGCKRIKVSYQDPLGLIGVSRQAIVSNETPVCFE